MVLSVTDDSTDEMRSDETRRENARFAISTQLSRPIRSALVGINCWFYPISQSQASNYVICIIDHATFKKGSNPIARNPRSRSPQRFSHISTFVSKPRSTTLDQHLTPDLARFCCVCLHQHSILAVSVSSQFLTHESVIYFYHMMHYSIVQSAVLLSHVVCLPVCLSVRDVGGS